MPKKIKFLMRVMPSPSLGKEIKNGSSDSKRVMFSQTCLSFLIRFVRADGKQESRRKAKTQKEKSHQIKGGAYKAPPFFCAIYHREHKFTEKKI